MMFQPVSLLLKAGTFILVNRPMAVSALWRSMRYLSQIYFVVVASFVKSDISSS